jgi:hypothetical protein
VASAEASARRRLIPWPIPHVVCTKTFKGPAVALAIVLLVGTLGYRMIGETKATWLDCF